MDSALPHLPVWAYIAVAILTVLVVAQSLKGQTLKVGKLWIVPTTLIVLTAVALSQEPARSLPLLALDGSALTGGAALGWWRGQFTKIAIDPKTHALRSYTSPLGMMALLAVVAARMAFRVWFVDNAYVLHLSVNQATDAMLLVALGFVCAERVELGIRGARLLRETRLEQLRQRVSPVPPAPFRRR